LSYGFNPSEYFIRSYPDNPSIMSAYGFMLGVNPNLVDGLALIEEKDQIEPLRDAHVDDARRALYLDKPAKGSKPVYVHSGNSDGFFFKDISETYPGLKKDFENNIKAASEDFQKAEGSKLFYKLSALMNVPMELLDFSNIAMYLDDYISAYSNSKEVAPFTFDPDTLDQVSKYYTYLMKYGLLRDRALNKVLAHPFLYSLLRELLFKAQDKQELDRWEGPCVSSKVSLAFGNRLTYLAAMRVLGIDKDVVYNPGWGDQLTIELLTDNNKPFVRIFNNNDLVILFSKNGNIPLDDFKSFICSKLYYGNMDAVEDGFEDYHNFADVKGGNCDALTEITPLFG
jgi:hypothetical protein